MSAPAAPPPARVQASGATALGERLWGPDVSRGIALLGIAFANMYYYLQSDAAPRGGDAVESHGSTIVDALTVVFFDNRGFPLFSFLFGYGIAMLWRKAEQRGRSRSEFFLAMLARHGILLGIGILHALVLFAGDIIVTYALLGVVISALVIAPRWVPLVAGALALPSLGLMGAMDGSAMLMSAYTSPDVTGNVVDAFGYRVFALGFVVMGLPFLSLGILVPMILGVFAEQWGFFTRVRERRALMVAIAVGGTVLSILGALPALWLRLSDPSVDGVVNVLVMILHQYTGVIGSVGYAATAALLAAGRPLLLYPLAALGTMSMSGYLFQSVVAVVVYPQFALGASAWMDSQDAALVSLGTWLFTVLAATVIRSRGMRGPVEWLFRRLLYRRSASTPHASLRLDRPPQQDAR